MHYYQKNIGDYYTKASRLSMLEHGAYNQLIDACYDRERFPTLEEALEWTWASTKKEVKAVEFVLSKFFIKEGDLYIQKRIKEDLDKYKITALVNKLIAVSREAKKRGETEYSEKCNTLRERLKNEALPSEHAAWSSVVDALIKEHDHSPNQEPRTNNQEPITKDKEGGSEESPAAPAKKSKSKTLKTYISECSLSGVDPIAEDSIVFRNAETLGLPYQFVLIAWSQFKEYFLDTKPQAKKVDWVLTFNNCLKDDGYGAYRRNQNGEWFLTTKGKNTKILMETEVA